VLCIYIPALDFVTKIGYIIHMNTEVLVSKKAQKDIKKLPLIIKIKFYTWVKLLDEHGLKQARKVKGFNDEALKGNRKGERSIRLNRAYRAIYIEKGGNLELIEVLEVNKHEY
jgi:proteic killer suppression protein